MCTWTVKATRESWQRITYPSQQSCRGRYIAFPNDDPMLPAKGDKTKKPRERSQASLPIIYWETMWLNLTTEMSYWSILFPMLRVCTTPSAHTLTPSPWILISFYLLSFPDSGSYFILLFLGIFPIPLFSASHLCTHFNLFNYCHLLGYFSLLSSTHWTLPVSLHLLILPSFFSSSFQPSTSAAVAVSQGGCKDGEEASE